MENVLSLLLGLCIGAVGAYLSGYSRKKGENLATKEDIKELAAQTAVLTQTAKEIESTISDKMWDRQKRWELKRDQIFIVAQKAAAIKDTLINLRSASREPGASTSPRLVENGEAIVLALGDLDNAAVMASLVCSVTLYEVVFSFVQVARKIASDLLGGDRRAFDDQMEKFVTQYAALRKVLQQELSETEASSAAPGSTANVAS